LTLFIPHRPPLLLLHDTPPPHIYPLSLHDALPILCVLVICSLVSVAIRKVPSDSPWQLAITAAFGAIGALVVATMRLRQRHLVRDRKSTRLNSSHGSISYAVFCLKKKSEVTVDDGS